MPKLTQKAIRLVRMDGRTDPDYRKASLLTSVTTSISSEAKKHRMDKQTK